MNKDIIYIEPEDDITDIISKIKQAKEKVVALVPPKKTGVLRSAVNTKLIAKAGRMAEKNVVIITTDASLAKLAVAAGLPIAKNLNSRPIMPTEAEAELIGKKSEDVIDEKAEAVAAAADGARLTGATSGRVRNLGNVENEVESNTGGTSAASKPKVEDASDKPDKSATKEKESFPIPGDKKDVKLSDDTKEGDKDRKKEDGKEGKSGKKIPDLEKYRKFIIAGVIGLIVIIAVSIWAFAIAPAAEITVSVKTTGQNFSEVVSFTGNKADQNLDNNLFYLEEVKEEQKISTEFTPTGKEDRGEKATGKLNLVASMNKDRTEIAVPAGTIFAYDGLQYVTGAPLNFIIDEEEDDTCPASKLLKSGCTISATIAVTAVENGEKYNIGAHSSGWSSSIAGISASNTDPFSGGVSKTVTIVLQSDVDKAKENLAVSKESSGKSALEAKFKDDIMTIESSYSKVVGDPISTPAVGAEVADGAKAKLEATTTYSMYGVEASSIKKYLTDRITKELSGDQKIYSLGSPFFENFDGKALTARLKTTAQIGPKVSESDILEKSKGRKIGEVQSLLKSIEGVNDVKIETSYFWVNSVPDDPNKITVELTINK